MRALVDEFAAARQFWIGTPFALIADPAAVAIEPADEHQLAERAGVHQLTRFAQGAMVAVIEPNAHAHARALRRRDHRLKLRGTPGSRLLHEHVPAALERRFGDFRERVVECGHNYEI